MTISISILQTGSIAVRPSAYSQPSSRSFLLRRVHLLIDRSWTPPLPINNFLITHPDGPILFDTGLSPSCMEPGYNPFWNVAFHLLQTMHIGPGEGIGDRLAEHGIKPADLQAVVLSHLHHDHAGGLKDVVDAKRTLVQKDHWEEFSANHLWSTINGAQPQHWPEGFNPEMLKPIGGPVGPWEKSYPITSDGKVVAVDTPGHVRGHISLVVYADAATYLMLGDASYDLGCLDREETDGVNEDPVTAVETLRKIKEFARGERVVVLPAHDVDAREILERRRVFVPTTLEK